MSANEIKVSNLISKMMMAKFSENLVLTATASRKYKTDFTQPYYKQGDVVNIRRRTRSIPTEGNVADLNAYKEKITPLVIDQRINDSREFDGEELALFMDSPFSNPFTDKVICPMAEGMFSKIESYLSNLAVTQLSYTFGTPGTPISSLNSLLSLRAQMIKLEMPVGQDSYLALNPDDAAALKGSLKDQFNLSLNKDVNENARLGRLGGFDLLESNHTVRHQPGSGDGTPLVNGDVFSGNTIPMKGFTPSATNVIRKGDVISTGVLGAATAANAVSPIQKKDTGNLMQFTAQSDINADGSGNALVPINVEIVGDISDEYRNIVNPTSPTISAKLPDDAPVNILGAGGDPYNVNIAYCREALQFVMPPLQKLINKLSAQIPNDKLNIYLAATRDGSFRTYQNGMRVDALYGGLFEYEYAFKYVS